MCVVGDPLSYLRVAGGEHTGLSLLNSGICVFDGCLMGVGGVKDV